MLRRMFTQRAKVERGPSEATIGGLQEPQRLLTELLDAHGLQLPVTTSALAVFERACAEGRGSGGSLR